MSNVIALLLTLWKPNTTSFQALWIERWGIVFLGIIGLYIYQQRIHWIFKTFLICIFSQCVISGLFSGFFEGELASVLKSLSVTYAFGIVCFLLFLKIKIDLQKSLFWMGWAVLVGIAISKDPKIEVYVLHNPSMSATFVVLATMVHPLSLIAVVLTHSWTAFFCFTAGIICRYRRYIHPIFLIAIALCINITPDLKDHIPDNGRFAIWKHIYKFWNQQDLYHYLFGLGAGSSRVYLPMIEFKGGQTAVFLWAHNDWLQFMVEFGLVGILIAVSTYFYALHKTKDKEVMIAFAVAMCTNFPCHYAATMLIGWSLAKGVINEYSKVPSS